MLKEIERKFLVIGEFKPFASSSVRICQGYLCSDSERTVRIRLQDKKGFITVKGRSSANGMSRFEWEKEISADDANALFSLCLPGMIDKTRFIVPYQNHIIEVDEFHGHNSGLIMAEIELQSENELFEKPDWLGDEVTGNIKYYNAYLSKIPYSQWK